MKKEKVLIIIISIACIVLLIITAFLFYKNRLLNQKILDKSKDIYDYIIHTKSKEIRVLDWEDHYLANDGKEYTRIKLQFNNKVSYDVDMKYYLFQLANDKGNIGQCYTAAYDKYSNLEGIYGAVLNADEEKVGYLYCTPSSKEGNILKISYLIGGYYKENGDLEPYEIDLSYYFR